MPKDLTLKKAGYHLTKVVRGDAAIYPLLELLDNNGIKCSVAGGCARWMLSPNKDTPPAQDIDIYLFDNSSLDSASLVLTKAGFTNLLDTKNAITFGPPQNSIQFGHLINVQLIKPINSRYGHPTSVIENFDLNVSQAAVWLEDRELKGYVSNHFMIGEEKLKIRVMNNDFNPLALMQRLCKYSAKGYTIPSVEMLKPLVKWSEIEDAKRSKITKLVKTGKMKEIYDLLDL